MRKFNQLLLVIISCVSVVTLLIYRHEYYRLRYVIEVLNFFGKPGVSEIEFCGPGFNATLLSEIVHNNSIEVKETPPLFQQIDDNFYSYASYLRSYQKYGSPTTPNAHEVDSIVIGKSNQAVNFRCNIWIEGVPKPKPGRFKSFSVVGNINNYSVYIFQCTMQRNLGEPQAVSFYSNDFNINPLYAAINKIVKINTVRKDVKSNLRFVNGVRPALCVIPNIVPIVSKEEIIQFLTFHHMIGIRHFTIYDSMVSEDTIRRLNLLPDDIKQWDLRFFPLNFPFIFAKSYEVLRTLIKLDCMYRHYRVKDELPISHVVVMSWDEFLVPRQHNSFISAIHDIELSTKNQVLKLDTLLFCLNQNDDENVDSNHPDIMKKLHYYKIPGQMNKMVLVENLDAWPSSKYFLQKEQIVKEISIETLAVHKYTECINPKNSNAFSYNKTEMSIFQHKYEAAMLRLGADLLNDKIYKLYTKGQLWEIKSSMNEVRDML